MTQTAPVALSHAGFHVFDMKTMVDFFTSVFGLTITDHGFIEGRGEVTFLCANPAEHHNLVLYEGRTSPRGAVHHNHVSFRLDSLDRLRKIHADLQAHPEVNNVTPICHGMTWSIYAHDPEGNRTEAFVDAPFFVDQPFGIPWDTTLDDEALYRETEKTLKGNPSFKTREEWRAGFAEKLGLN